MFLQSEGTKYGPVCVTGDEEPK